LKRSKILPSKTTKFYQRLTGRMAEVCGFCGCSAF
jgi:hypothetical protein